MPNRTRTVARAVSAAVAASLVIIALPMLGAIASAQPVPRPQSGIDPGPVEPHPAPYAWSNGALEVQFLSEEPIFYATSLSNSLINVSVAVTGLIEITPSGTIVAYAPFEEGAQPWIFSWTNGSGGVNVTLSRTAPVLAAEGNVAFGLPTEAGAAIGSTAVTIGFHLAPEASATAWTVEFSLLSAHWGWVSANDTLGLIVGITSVGHADLAGRSAGGGVDEIIHHTQTAVASVTWAPSASVTYPTQPPMAATVTSTFPSGPEGDSALALLQFGGVSGNYSQLSYDPTVVLYPTSYGASGAPFLSGTAGGLLGLVGGLGLVAILTVAAIRVRGGGLPASISEWDPAREPSGRRKE